MKKIICLGSATKDIFVPLESIKIADNPGSLTEKKFFAFEYGAKIYADGIFQFAGGSAVNVAAGLSKCGFRTFVFSRTDKGETGKWILKNVARMKIKKNYMQQNGGSGSETSIIILDKKTIEHIIIRTGDSVESFNLEKAVDKFREKIDWIFVGSQKKNWEKNMATIVNFAKGKKAKLALNPSGYQIGNNAKKLAGFFKNFEVVFINRDEAIEIVKNSFGKTSDDIKLLFEKIKSFGCKNIVITDAENGAYAWSQATGIFHLEISADKKIDSTGAGDAFASGFLASFAEKEDLRSALCCGIANSGSVVAKIGATDGLLKMGQLKNIGKRIDEKVKIIK